MRLVRADPATTERLSAFDESFVPMVPATKTGGVLCRVLGHEWEPDQMRVTHGRVVCDRCGAAEWRQN